MDGIEGVTCSDLTFAPRCSSTQNFGEIARLAMNFNEKAQLASTPFNPMASNTLPSYPFRYEVIIYVQPPCWYPCKLNILAMMKLAGKLKCSVIA